MAWNESLPTMALSVERLSETIIINKMVTPLALIRSPILPMIVTTSSMVLTLFILDSSIPMCLKVEKNIISIELLMSTRILLTKQLVIVRLTTKASLCG